jgi:hypothetical protein
MPINIWFDHWVWDADDDAERQTPGKPKAISKVSDDDDFKPRFTWNDVGTDQQSGEKNIYEASTKDPGEVENIYEAITEGLAGESRIASL